MFKMHENDWRVLSYNVNYIKHDIIAIKYEHNRPLPTLHS